MSWFKGFLKDKKNAAIQILLIAGIAILANMLAQDMIVRFDLTANNRYTLSPASIEIAKSLQDPITVSAYFSKDLPPQLIRVKDELQNFLDEFRAYSNDNLEYHFVNPNESDMSETKAQQAGIRPVTIDVRKRDQVSQKRAYLGAVFKYQGKKQVIPVIQPGSGLEYSIASTIKELTIQKKPKIGLLQGDGEPTQQMMPQLFKELRQQYQVISVSGLDTTSVPADIEALMVIAPKQKLSQKEVKAIDQYIMAGGHAVFALNEVQTNLQRGMARVQDTGLEPLLNAYHLSVKPDLVYDANSSTIRVQQQQGGFSIVNSIQYPYIPAITNFANHPISKGLETVRFQFVSSLDTTEVDSSQSLTVLAKSSENSGEARGRFDLNPMRQWSRSDFDHSYMPVAAAIQGTFQSPFANVDSVDVPLTKSKNTSIVVFGDGDFLVNGEGQRRQRLADDNINLMVNTIDWLADDTGLISLRTQGVTNRPLEQITDSTKAFLKYLNLFLPILLVLGYGFYRYQRRKARRRKWIEEGI
ncbi:MAG: Gldg family protein [Balneolaceae bacterium]|jgi:gliding-associated putative ABC transporter substrate-binding component GldG